MRFVPSLSKYGPLLASTALLSLVCAIPQAAHAQANLAFTGGSGSQLTVTLLNSVSYQVTAPGGVNGAPVFAFQGTGNLFNKDFTDVTGSLSYRINNGAVQTFSYINSGFATNDLAANDSYIFGGLQGVSVGDVVTLTEGTLTTTSTVAAARPTDGSYTTFLFRSDNGDGTRISSNGVAAVTAVPEPGEWATMGMAGAGLCGLMVRARRKKAVSSPATA